MGVYGSFYNRERTPLELAKLERRYAMAQLRKSWVRNNPKYKESWEAEKQRAEQTIAKLEAQK